MIGIRMRTTGHSPDQIRDAIETNAPAMRRESMEEAEFNAKYRNRNWSGYAAETTNKFVFGLRGIEQYESTRRYRPRLMKVEGRDAMSEKRAELLELAKLTKKAESEHKEEITQGR
jgi:hypothetical protein